MTILTVRTFTDPVLRKKVTPVAEITPEIEELAHDMIETMYFSHGIGLAAPQVGKSLALITIDVNQDNESLHPMIFINPSIIKRSTTLAEFEEGCLSIPTYNGVVERPEQITIRFQTLDGKIKTLPAKGILARVLQHEMDHLEGTLFTDHLPTTWWEGEEGRHMEAEHPLFAERTYLRHANNRSTSDLSSIRT